MVQDIRDTELGRKATEQHHYETLYDPPVNGATPLDGAGNPRSSTIHGPDIANKLRQGFTREPIVPEAEPEETPKRRR